MRTTKDTLLSILLIPFFVAYALGGLIGAIYWAVQESLLDVVLSVFIPMYGAVSTIIDVFF